MEKTIDELYEYLQALKNRAGVNINYLDDAQVKKMVNKNELNIDQICAICEIRYWYNVVAMDNLKVIEKKDDASCDTTIETNLSFISKKGSEYGKSRNENLNEFDVNTYFLSTHKVKSFNNALLNIEEIKNKRQSQRILYIGARTEAELLAMSKFGFDVENIKAIDLYTYSSMIEIGDMHNIPFENNSFELVIMTHCIAYSEEPIKAFKEAIRVTDNGGHVMFSVSTIQGDKSNQINIPKTGANNRLTFEEYLSILNSLETVQQKTVFQDQSNTMKIAIVKLKENK